LLARVIPTARAGARPKTERALPHRQIDQLPPAPIFHRLLELCKRMPGINVQESRLAAPDTIALWIATSSVCGPAEAFIDDHEFCHIHCLPEGGIHLTLPSNLARRAEKYGWAEPHILARAGIVPDTLVLVYAPRDERELDAVWRLVVASFHFASGA